MASRQGAQPAGVASATRSPKGGYLLPLLSIILLSFAWAGVLPKNQRRPKANYNTSITSITLYNFYQYLYHRGYRYNYRYGVLLCVLVGTHKTL